MADRISRLRQAPRVELDVDIRLTMHEVLALEALVGYGIEGFLKVFYEQMGRHYLEPHEKGLRSLFDTINHDLAPLKDRAENAWRAFYLADAVVRSRKEHNQMIGDLVERAKTAEAKLAALTQGDSHHE